MSHIFYISVSTLHLLSDTLCHLNPWSMTEVLVDPSAKGGPSWSLITQDGPVQGCGLPVMPIGYPHQTWLSRVASPGQVHLNSSRRSGSCWR
eukprot:5463097-Amphidinium_carterae.2